MVAALFERQYEHMVRVAYLMLGSRAAAEDATQDAFARVELRWPQLHDPDGYLRPAADLNERGDEALEDIARFVGHTRPATTAGYVKRLGGRPRRSPSGRQRCSTARWTRTTPGAVGVRITPGSLGATLCTTE